MSVEENNNVNDESVGDLDDSQQSVRNPDLSDRRNMLKKAAYVAPIVTAISFSDRALASGKAVG